MASYDGSYIFGFCKSFNHVPNSTVSQANEFFGVDGTHSLYGGTRGRTFQIEGYFVGQFKEDCLAAEAVLQSYADGIARVITDNFGRSYDNVIFEGRYQPSPAGPRPAVLGGSYVYALEYKCEFRGLT